MMNNEGCIQGRLKVRSVFRDRLGKLRYLCECLCGTMCCPLKRDVDKLRSVSCGCAKRDVLAARNYTHRMTGTKVWRAWNSMLRRCRNPRAYHYDIYGGRGISVCARWLAFENFYADMGNPPTDKHTLDRIDSNGDYSKENCRWATNQEQCLNRRNNRLVTYDGKTLPMSVWAEKLNLIYSSAIWKLNKGIPVETIFATTVRQ